MTNVRFMDSDSDPHKRFSSNQYALFPLKRLEYDTAYRVELEFESKEEVETLVWYFHTQKPTETFHTVTKKEEKLTIASGQSHIIYFRPLHGHDIIKNIQFPSEMDVVFLDNNTIKLTLGNEIDDFDIVSATRRLHIKIQ